MKKLQDREIQIKIAQRRFKKNQKRKKRRKRLKAFTFNEESKDKRTIHRERKLRLKRQLNKYIKLRAPENFSIIRNSEETLAFFDEIQNNMRNYEPIDIDMQNIKNMTVDALVYYIAVLQKMRTQINSAFLKGSFPKDERILDLMQRSGFLRYFNTSKKNIQTHHDYIEIKSGNIADNQVVKYICIFVMEKLEVERTKIQKLYDIIFEMMLNTRQHAYNTAKSGYDNWLLFSKYYPEKQSIDFIFMDTGYGIPKTVTMNKLERAKFWLSNIGITNFTESDLVQSALHGALRTKTKEGYRGKGLPRIQKMYTDGYINNLNILSNKACIFESGKCDLKKEMIGTLYFWKITKGSISENAKNK